MIYLLIITICVSLYVLFNTYFVKITNKDIKAQVPGKFSFVHISDIHGTIRFLNGKLSNIINSLKPDFVVVTGDLSNHQKQLPIVLKELESIKAEKGIFAVLGNYESQEIIRLRKRDRDIDSTIKLIRSAKRITLLTNQHHLMNINKSTVLIYGFDNSTYGRESYCHDTDSLKYDYKIVLAHSPNIIKYIEKNNISYNQVLVGHTHGGQIRLFKNPQLGEYKGFHIGAKSYGTGLFCISKGLGTVKLPFRFNCSPEISVYNVMPESSRGHASL